MCERGQGTVEWVALVLVVAVALAAGAVGAGALGAPGLARAIRCAVLAGCRGEDALLERVYGADVAAHVRAWAPGIAYEPGTLALPIDFRRCRSHRCADALEARGRDVWRARDGRTRATVFTHVVDRRRAGGALYVQYWLYYPDSTYLGPAHRLSRLPVIGATPAGRLAAKAAAHHADDWESYQVRIGRDGSAWARASAHWGFAGRRRWPNLNELPVRPPVPRRGNGAVRVRLRERTAAWARWTGWTRVSRGSHAGHIPNGPARDERRTKADGLALVPIESLSDRDRATRFAVIPPWRKPVYADPERTDT